MINFRHISTFWHATTLMEAITNRRKGCQVEIEKNVSFHRRKEELIACIEEVFCPDLLFIVVTTCSIVRLYKHYYKATMIV